MNKKIEQAFNDHLNAEFFSSYLYLSMANCFTAKNLDGMASWMRLQSEEERVHAMKFLDFINQRGGRVRCSRSTSRNWTGRLRWRHSNRRTTTNWRSAKRSTPWSTWRPRKAITRRSTSCSGSCPSRSRRRRMRWRSSTN